jgi:hypothetical protein
LGVITGKSLINCYVCGVPYTVKSRNKLRDHEKNAKICLKYFASGVARAVGADSQPFTFYILHFTMNRMNKNKHLTTEEIAIIIQLYRTNLHSQAERKPVCYANEVYQKNAKQKTEKLKKFMANCNDINDIKKKIKKIQYGDPRMVSSSTHSVVCSAMKRWPNNDRSWPLPRVVQLGEVEEDESGEEPECEVEESGEEEESEEEKLKQYYFQLFPNNRCFININHTNSV